MRRAQRLADVMVALLAAASLATAAATPIPHAELTVLLVAKDGRQVQQEVYVGVLPETGPMSAPVEERRLDAGGPISFTLPPGTYRLACSAVGFAPRVELIGALGPGERREERCVLEALVILRGLVSSTETGKPLEGAEIVPLTLLDEAFPDRFSRIGTAHLWRSLTAHTDATGRFGIAATAATRSHYVVRAPATAARILENVLAPASGADLGEIALEPGGALEVVAEAPTPDALEGLVVSLGTFRPGEFRSETERVLWRASVPATGRVEFGSLPVGLYGVMLEGPRFPRRGLAYVEIAAGGLEVMKVPLSEAVIDGRLAAKSGLDPASLRAATVTLTSECERLDVRVDILTGGPEIARFRATPRLAGTFAVLLRGSDVAGGYTALGQVEVPAVTTVLEANFELPTGELSGLVLGVGGEPVEGAEVLVTGTQPDPICATHSDASGGWSCSWLPRGELAVIARHPLVGVSEVQELGVDGSRRVHNLVLGHGRELGGRLVVPAGYSPAQALVGFGLPDRPGVVFRTTTADDGSFLFGELPSGAGIILVRPKERTLAFAVARIGARQSGEVGVLESSEAGRAFALGSMAGGRWDRCVLPVLDYEGAELADGLFYVLGSGPGPVSPGGAGGFYRLAPGGYRLRWRDFCTGTEVGHTRPFRVQSGELTIFSSTLSK